jgi:hypothetical protein
MTASVDDTTVQYLTCPDERHWTPFGTTGYLRWVDVEWLGMATARVYELDT